MMCRQQMLMARRYFKNFSIEKTHPAMRTNLLKKIKRRSALIEIRKLQWPFPPETVSRFCRLNDNSPWVAVKPTDPWPP